MEVREGVEAGAMSLETKAAPGGLLDVPLHHDEEERLVFYKTGTYPPKLFVLTKVYR